MTGKFAVKTQIGNFYGVSPDMKLKQTIQRSKKSCCWHYWSNSAIIICHRMGTYLSWSASYFCDVYLNIISAGLSFRETNLHHELGASLYKLMNGSVNKTYRFISERGNLYLTSQYLKLYHLTTGQCVNETDSKKLLEYFEHGEKT